MQAAAACTFPNPAGACHGSPEVPAGEVTALPDSAALLEQLCCPRLPCSAAGLLSTAGVCPLATGESGRAPARRNSGLSRRDRHSAYVLSAGNDCASAWRCECRMQGCAGQGTCRMRVQRASGLPGMPSLGEPPCSGSCTWHAAPPAVPHLPAQPLRSHSHGAHHRLLVLGRRVRPPCARRWLPAGASLRLRRR